MKRHLSKRNKRLITGLTLLAIAVAFLCVYEFVLRKRGVQPFKPSLHNVIYEPEFIYAPSHRLGYKLKPGSFTFMMCNLDSMVFQPTHDSNAHRITRPSGNGQKPDRSSVVMVFGGSLTYGFGVADSLTYPYLLQQTFPNVDVQNRAVPGYAGVHAIIMLQMVIEEGNIPSVALLNYSHYQDETNTLPRKSRESITRFSNVDNAQFMGRSNFPYAAFNEEGDLEIDHIPFGSFYTEWPLRRNLAFVNFLEMKYNEIEHGFYDHHGLTQAVIMAIKNLCTEHGIKLVVVGISEADLTRKMLEFCTNNAILNVDISMNLYDNEELMIHPRDGHPNAKAHGIYAKRMSAFLKKEGKL